MARVIQLRGTNATGKTTAIRQFINRGTFSVKEIPVGGRLIEYHWNAERKIAILGRYDQCMSGGVDGYITSKELLGSSILRILRCVKPNALLFEGIVYGVTFQFAYELNSILKRMGCEYIGICFLPPLDVALERLKERNGGKAVDIDSVSSKWFTASKAYEKLKAAGVQVKAVDTSTIPKQDMWKVIEREL